MSVHARDAHARDVHARDVYARDVHARDEMCTILISSKNEFQTAPLHTVFCVSIGESTMSTISFKTKTVIVF